MASVAARSGRANRRPSGYRAGTKIAELLADQRCSQAILEFLATTDVGRQAHRWQKKKQKQRPASLGVGEQGSRGASRSFEGGRTVWGEEWADSLSLFLFFILFYFYFLYFLFPVSFSDR